MLYQKFSSIPVVVENSYSDPDLIEPETPLTLTSHPGVKKIYNQGLSEVIRKNYATAITVFENFNSHLKMI